MSGQPERYQLMPRRRKRYWAKVLRKASALPITFRDSRSSGVAGDRGGGRGVDRVGGGVTGVTGDVGGCGGMTGGACGSPCRSVIGVAGGGVGDKCGGARLAHR